MHDTIIVNPLLCNQNCNQTCCDKKTENKFNQTKCEKCGSTNGKYGNKYSIKNEIPSTTTQEIITAHTTTSSTSKETTPVITRTEFTTTTATSTSSQPKSTSIQTTTIADTTVVSTTEISITSTFKSSTSSSSFETTTTIIPIKTTDINSSPTILTSPIRTTSIATSYSTRISTTSSVSHSYIGYGCVIFDVAGDIYFNISDNSAAKCIKECLIRNSSFQFFITSYFEG